MRKVYLLTGRSSTKGDGMKPSKKEDFEIRVGDAGESPVLDNLYKLKIIGRARWHSTFCFFVHSLD